MEIDKIDYKILKILQNQGDIANSDLADKVGVSKTACWNRTKRLHEQGYILQIRAELNPDQLGLSVLVYVGVILERSTTNSFATFEAAVQKIPVIMECVLLTGDFDYWMKIRVKDIQSFKRLYASTLLSLPGVQQLRSFFTLGEVKTNKGLLIESP